MLAVHVCERCPSVPEKGKPRVNRKLFLRVETFNLFHTRSNKGRARRARGTLTQSLLLTVFLSIQSLLLRVFVSFGKSGDGFSVNGFSVDGVSVISQLYLLFPCKNRLRYGATVNPALSGNQASEATVNTAAAASGLSVSSPFR